MSAGKKDPMLIHKTKEEWENERMALIRSGRLAIDASQDGKVIEFPARTIEPMRNTL